MPHSHLVSVDVLRSQVLQRVEAAHRGEVTLDWLRGYLTAMFHAGVISDLECRQLLQGNAGAFELTPPDVVDDERGRS